MGPAVYLRDIGYAEDGADILTSYALVNGRRAVYIAATKRADASTLDGVRNIRRALPSFQAAVPEDIRVSFELDQSFYVTRALRALLQEGLAGKLLKTNGGGGKLWGNATAGLKEKRERLLTNTTKRP